MDIVLDGSLVLFCGIQMSYLFQAELMYIISIDIPYSDSQFVNF